MAKDYYVILGVSRGAALNQIKQAYRRIAKKVHPDLARSQADAAKFIELKEAYDALAEAARSRRHEFTSGAARLSPSIRRPHGAAALRRPPLYRKMEAPESLVDEFFGGLVPGMHAGRRGPAPEKDLYLELVLSPRESLEGGLFPISFPVLEPCPRCESEDLINAFFCPVCHGHGAVSSERRFSLSIPPHITNGTEVTLSLEEIGLRGVLLHVWVRVDPLLTD